MEKFNLKEFLNKNKVFLAGLLQFVLTSLMELFDAGGTESYSPWIVGYSAGIAILTYLGRNLRGQWASISMSLLSSLMVYGGLNDTNVPITTQIIVTRIVLPLGLAILGIFFTSPAKNREYEHSEPIVQAKAEAKVVADAKKNA